jgi:C-terminal processing protease CtpA/Prc
MWIQEGLASVFEMYELDASDDRFDVLDNNRINIAINLRGVNGLMKWKTLFTLSDNKFVNSRPRAHYAEARAVLQFLAEQGLLQAWYRAYTESYLEDSTGRLAFEKVLDQDITDIERAFRAWLNEKSSMPLEIDDAWPALGLFVADQGANDGVEIVGIHPGGAARVESVLAHDVITAIDGRAVFSVEEVIVEMMRKTDGEEVSLHLRRGTRYLDVTIIIRPVTPPRDFEFFQKPGVSV